MGQEISIVQYAKTDDVECIKRCICRGEDVNTQNDKGDTALHNTCRYGFKDMVELLIIKGADVNVCNKDKDTPLQFACQNGHKDIVKILIENGADVNTCNKDKDTPLHFASLNGCKKIVKTLIENGANVNSRNNCGDTVIDILIPHYYYTDVIEIINKYTDENVIETEIQDIQAQYPELECISCRDNKRCIMFNCNHINSCNGCSKQLNECPECRKEIYNRTVVYIN